jgi:hypothetical protein
MSLSEILGVASVVGLALAIGLLGVLRAGVTKAAETSAEKGVEEAFKRANWPRELARMLEQARGEERQQLRFASYGELWARMQPLAFYADHAIDAKLAGELSTSLSGWYFSARGGLFLTEHVRDLYFSLQDLLRTVSHVPGWTARRPAGDSRDLLEEHARDKLPGVTRMYLYLDETPASKWPGDFGPALHSWEAAVGALTAEWAHLTPELRFAVLQQVGSVLRTALTKDVESRLR